MIKIFTDRKHFKLIIANDDLLKTLKGTELGSYKIIIFKPRALQYLQFVITILFVNSPLLRNIITYLNMHIRMNEG